MLRNYCVAFLFFVRWSFGSWISPGLSLSLSLSRKCGETRGRVYTVQYGLQ